MINNLSVALRRSYFDRAVSSYGRNNETVWQIRPLISAIFGRHFRSPVPRNSGALSDTKITVKFHPFCFESSQDWQQASRDRTRYHLHNNRGSYLISQNWWLTRKSITRWVLTFFRLKIDVLIIKFSLPAFKGRCLHWLIDIMAISGDSIMLH